MGNTSSSGGRGHHDETVDYGHLVPQGVYTGPRDWNHTIVSQLIVGRRLAPFYRPLEDYEESWDDDQVLAARKEQPHNPENPDHPPRSESIHSVSTKSTHSKRSVTSREQMRPEAAVYRGAVECPICFLYYPPNINYSRCCDQAICTECFVQIKRNEPTTTHLVSEPAACPYCVQEKFGVVYRPPSWRAGVGSDSSHSPWPEPPKESTTRPTHRRRQKSFSADSPEVVATDQIRPDWEAKLAAVRAAVARRANRRIIMRQVGDRLIPVGVTSGRIHALNPEEVGAEAAEGGGGRRRRRNGGNSQLEQFMSIPGQDLEELMLMEAMRLSLIEHEEQQRREADERRKQEAAAAAAAAAADDSSESNTNHGVSTGTQVTSASGSELRLPTQPSDSSIPSSSQTSLAPASTLSASWQNNESLDTTRNPQSNLRNQASQPASDRDSNNGESFTSWNSRASNTAPFSTSNIAFTPASTAVAILGPPLSSQRQEVRVPETSNTVARSASSSPLPPTAAPGYNHHAPSTDNSEHERPALPPKPTIMTSSPIVSRDVSGNESDNTPSSYGRLLSSPDSDSAEAYEPLLAGSPNRAAGLGAESGHDSNNPSRSHSRTATPSPDDRRVHSANTATPDL